MTIDRFYFYFSDNDLLEHMDDVGDAHHLIHAGADRIRTIKAESARLRDALKRIAEHGCGCDPVCVCRSEGHIRIELDEKISLAKEALKATE